MHAQVIEERFGVAAGESLVSQDDLPALDKMMVNLQEGGHHLTFAEFRMGQAPGDWHAFHSGDQI